MIHDMVVVPSLTKDIDGELFEMERSILQKELSRVYEFAKVSMNMAQTVNELYPWLGRFNLSLADMSGKGT